MWLVDLNFNFEWDWLTELADNKLSFDNNLTSELEENKSFFLKKKNIHNRGTAFFMINGEIVLICL